MTAITTAERGWDFFRNEGRIGTGDWSAFPHSRLPELFAAADRWNQALAETPRPWLCWCIDPRWCYVQQQLVSAAGWTPVVGADGSQPRPPLVGGAIFIDFNESLHLPGMWMHFVLEFAFRFAGRLAFWHSDVLPPLHEMRLLAAQFEAADDGGLIATPKRLSVLYKIRRLLRGKRIREVDGWTEVAGCTTRGASQSQFEHGCGWWRHLDKHPNASSEITRRQPHWEHGVGIRYWERVFRGTVEPLCVDIAPFHYSRAGKQGHRYKRQMVGRHQIGSKGSELDVNFRLEDIVPTLGASIVLPD